jgi:hypothetical protein
VIFSSLRSGNAEDLVGRIVTNLTTENQKNSYFGVNLGRGRYLWPTCNRKKKLILIILNNFL